MGTHVAECSQQQEEGEHIFRSRYPPVDVPDNVTLPDFVLHNVELYADRLAFVDATTGKGYTYGEVARDIRRFAKALRSLGLRKGRVVLVVLPNVPEYAIVALGIMAAGGVFSGANPAAHSSEIMKQVESADGKLIVSDLPTIDKDGWLHTGDIGYIDDDGDIFLVDRIKELIKYKGFQVAPAELEGILLTHPSVEDAAAWVVLNSKAKESHDDIINFVASTAAHYKRVRVVQFVDSIPKSPSGKIMRRLIKEKMLEKLKEGRE